MARARSGIWLACQKVFGIVSSLAVTVSKMLCLNRGDGVLIRRSEVVEPILCNLVGVEVLKSCRLRAGTRFLAKARLETVVLCCLLAVNALYVRDIARRYQGLSRRVVGRRRIHSGCVLTRRYLEY